MKRIFFWVPGVLAFALAAGACGVVSAANQQDIYTNLALTATATASSEYSGGFAASNINDGIMNRWNQGEWASSGEGAGAWVQLAWNSAVKMNQVWLYSRPNKYDMIYDSYLYIDTDGNTSTWEHTVHVGMLGQGGVPKIINLTTSEGASVRTLRFYAAEASSDTQNAGLAEIECYMINGDDNTALGNGALYSNTTGTNNTATGYQALYSNTTGYYNTAAGEQALYNNTTGSDNTAVGYQALYSNTTGYDNTAAGLWALYSNTSGYGNTATGVLALYKNTTGYYNTAAGFASLYTNTTGYYNTAAGYNALYSNTSGYNNTAAGNQALYSNTTGYDNTAAGYGTLFSNTTGYNNTAAGYGALYSNTTGDNNTAAGYGTLFYNETGTNNTAAGYGALSSNSTGSFNTAVGYTAGNTNTTGSNNTFIGYGANASDINLSNATAIGNGAVVDASNKVRIGNGSVTVCEAPVAWTTPSDRRIKKDIQDDNLGLDFILKLRPVHFQMKEGHKGIIYDGFIAQDVEEAMKELGVTFSGLHKPDNPDNMYSLSYATFTVPLVNAVKELNGNAKDQKRSIEKQKTSIEKQKKSIEKQEARIERLEKEVKELKDLLAALQKKGTGSIQP